MKLKALSLSDLEQVRLWRNEQIEMLRTPFLLTREQQAVFYRDVVCNRRANARYWGIWDKREVGCWADEHDITPIREEMFIGMCGIENIQWENRLGEISLLLNGADTSAFKQSVCLVLQQGFMNLNLDSIYTEVYDCSPNIEFWLALFKEYKKEKFSYPVLPNRKYFDGQYFDSLYLNFTKEDFLEHENTFSKSAQTPD